MSVFADSSALVKLYSDEPGSTEVRSITSLVVSALARVEVPAALWRKQRSGKITVGQTRTLVSAFEGDLNGTGEEPPRFLSVTVSRNILNAAASLIALHPLRAYDSVQLASALAVKQVDDEFGGFACFDHALLDAAAIEGIRPPAGI